jgi:phosphate acetyltransferase
LQVEWIRQAGLVTVSALYIASPEGDTGKPTIALGILQWLAATVAKVGEQAL